LTNGPETLALADRPLALAVAGKLVELRKKGAPTPTTLLVHHQHFLGVAYFFDLEIRHSSVVKPNEGVLIVEDRSPTVLLPKHLK
jgi:hypothetical protein